MRSFWPSRMRWWTSTVSPTRKSGRSFLNPASSASMISRFFMVAFLFLLDVDSRGARAAPATGLRLLLAPAGHRLVVPADQYIGHRHAAEDSRSGVVRVLQPPGIAMGFLGHARCVAKHAGHVADHRVDHHHGGHFPAATDEIADRN